MHVFAVGKNELLYSTNDIEGEMPNPRVGSASAPVINCKTSCIDTPSRLPPENIFQEQ